MEYFPRPQEPFITLLSDLFIDLKPVPQPKFHQVFTKFVYLFFTFGTDEN
jgi:hypothetical protein